MEIISIEPFVDYYKRLHERTRQVVLLIPPEHLEWTYKPGKFTMTEGTYRARDTPPQANLPLPEYTGH